MATLYDVTFNVCLYPQNPGKAGHEIQSSTLELINGLVSLVHQQMMPDVAQEAMEASGNFLETECRLFPTVTIFLDLFPRAGYFFNALY